MTAARAVHGREHVVGLAEELPPGHRIIAPIGRHGVGVYNIAGRLHAIANYCPHEGGPLCLGRTRGVTQARPEAPGGAVEVRDGEFVYCPWHQWAFEIATGEPVVKPGLSVPVYAVRIDDGKIIVTA